jgi:hypothetical protein
MHTHTYSHAVLTVHPITYTLTPSSPRTRSQLCRPLIDKGASKLHTIDARFTLLQGIKKSAAIATFVAATAAAAAAASAAAAANAAANAAVAAAAMVVDGSVVAGADFDVDGDVLIDYSAAPRLRAPPEVVAMAAAECQRAYDAEVRAEAANANANAKAGNASSSASVAAAAAAVSGSVSTPQQPLHQLPFNFSTQLFFLTHECFGLGVLAMFQSLQGMQDRINQMHHMYQQRAETDPQRSMIKQQFNALVAQRFRYECLLGDKDLLRDIIAFFDWTCRWINSLSPQSSVSPSPSRRTSTADLRRASATTTTPPTTTTTAAAAAGGGQARPQTAGGARASLSSTLSYATAARHFPVCLPESLLDNTVMFFSYANKSFRRDMNAIVSSSSCANVFKVLVRFMGSDASDKMLAQATAVLVKFLPEELPRPPAAFYAPSDHLFNSVPECRASFVPSLMHVYCAMEKSVDFYHRMPRRQVGLITQCRSSQSLLAFAFATKHSLLHFLHPLPFQEIVKLFRFVWAYDVHRDALVTSSCGMNEGGTDAFSVFLNYLFNDTIAWLVARVHYTRKI